MRLLLLLPLIVPASALAQAKNYDFSAPDSASLVQNYAMPGGVASGAQASLENGTLKIVNRQPGSFGVQWKLRPIDVDKIAKFQFDFKASPDAKINFFFRVDGKYYGATLTGPQTLRPGSVLLGQFVISDLPNGWKHAEIPLREWMREALPGADKITIDEVISGNWDNDGYLLAGIGGNGPGATISFDNLNLSVAEASSAPPRVLAPVWQGNDLIVPLEAAAGIDTKTLKLSVAGKTFDLTSPLLHYDVTAKNGQWARQLRLEAGSAGLTFKDGESMPVVVEGVSDSLQRTAPRFETLVVFSYSAQQTTPDLPTMQVWNAATNAYEVVPGDDFEQDEVFPRQDSSILEIDKRQALDGQASLRLTNPRTASPFKTSLWPDTIDLTRYPVLTFDYLTDDRTRLDWRFDWNKVDTSIQFLDHDTKVTKAGKIDNPQTDSQWHSASANVLNMLTDLRANTKPVTIDSLSEAATKDEKKANEERNKIEGQKRASELAQNIINAPNFQISNLSLADDGWKGNARGVQIWLDNLRFAPSAVGALKAKFVLRDLTGTQALAWTFDQNRSTPVPLPKANTAGIQTTNGDTLELPLGGRGTGLWWLHLRAQNGSGKWSETAHFPVWVVAAT